MSHFSHKTSFLFFSLLLIPLFGFLFWYLPSPQTLSSFTENYQKLGETVKQDLATLPAVSLIEGAEAYSIEDTKDGIDIQFANEEETLKSEDDSQRLKLSFPKDYTKPIEVKLDKERIIPITDLSGKNGYSVDTLTEEAVENLVPGEEKTFLERFFPKQEALAPAYLRYQSNDDRKSLLYAYQKDQALGEKKLKHWTIYEAGTGLEKEEYRIDNAKVKINEEGEVEVFYFGQKEIQNEAVKAEVAPSLLERAERTLAKEMGEDVLNSSSPDFIIPKPYYLDREGAKHDAEWKWSEGSKTLSVSFSPASYPVALDPTLSFAAPGVSNGGSVITGEGSSSLGTSLAAGDFNSDGKTDLAVGASGYSSSTGRAYIFHNDGSIPTTAATADVIITGETTGTKFGISLAAGDFNSDGKTDLTVGARDYSTLTGRAYIFHNDGSIPTAAGSADVIITGESSSEFGGFLASGDFNADGKTDLAVGASSYSTNTGRAYIFYNDGSIPTTAATADVIITGETTSTFFGASLTAGDFNSDGKTDLAVGSLRVYIFYSQNGQVNTNFHITGETTSNALGYSLTAGDFNSDGKTDLAVGASSYSSSTGRTYIFYNDGSIPTTAGSADVIITGENTSDAFGTSLTAGDFNSDGKTDLAVGAHGYSSSTGRVYIFHNDGSIPTTAATADVIITGETADDSFGDSLTAGDFNADGTTDLAVGASIYSNATGRAYIFHNDGSIPTTAATADVTITGQGEFDYFGISLTSGDFNSDGRTDLAVGAHGYSGWVYTGRAYLFYNDGSIPTTAATANVTITGGASSNRFGYALTAGDFNADGTTDLAVGAHSYSGNTGRVYIFNNDGSWPTTAGTANVTITGAATNTYFGYSLTAGDFNADGKTDLAVGAFDTFGTSRAYIFYNDGSIPTAAGSADVVIASDASGDGLGSSLASGDFNADGKTDLAVGAAGYSSSTGRVYIYETRENFAWELQEQSPATTARTSLHGGQELTITGQYENDQFGYALASGDLNADGETDLAVGASGYSSDTGRAYIFYGDGSLASGATSADHIITGSNSGDKFGAALMTGDFNADGETDLVVGAPEQVGGYVYIFHNDGSLPISAADANVTITGTTSGDLFGYSMASGDFNLDGEIDLAIGASGYSSDTGRAYLFYNDGSIPTTAATANVIITGGAVGDNFGQALASGDLNADGETDLAVGAPSYDTNGGRAYIFHNDGSLATTAGAADVTITGEASSLFGGSLATGDFNADGTIDLAVGASGYSSDTGRAYIFHNDGSIPTAAGSADVIITGESSSEFGTSLTAGDYNNDTRIDLAVGAAGYSSDTGRVYIFHNDGSVPTTAATADVTFTGEATGDHFGFSLASGDFNTDGKTDLAVGADLYASDTGRVYMYTFNDTVITGENTSDAFGYTLTPGDFNADGTIDLAVGASGYSSDTGRVYIFHNDGSVPTTAATADVTITGDAAGDTFGQALTPGDFNADGTIDLAVGASGYSSDTGRVYIFTFDAKALTNSSVKTRGTINVRGTIKVR